MESKNTIWEFKIGVVSDFYSLSDTVFKKEKNVSLWNTCFAQGLKWGSGHGGRGWFLKEKKNRLQFKNSKRK